MSLVTPPRQPKARVHMVEQGLVGYQGAMALVEVAR
jgi:hypothetical protein